MVELLIFILASSGCTLILVFGKIFDKIRPRFEFFNCPQCIGFWIGVGFLIGGQFTTLWNFPITIVNCFIFGCITSICSIIATRYM